MSKHRRREAAKSFGSQIDPEKAEELRRTKIDIDNNLPRILKLIQNPKDSLKEEELVGLIQDFYNQYQSLYTLYDRLSGEYRKIQIPRRREKAVSNLSPSSSDYESEYFSSEEADAIARRSENERHNASAPNNHQLDMANANFYGQDHKFFPQSSMKRIKADGKELDSLNHQKRDLELQLKQLSAQNTDMQTRVLELESLLKEKGNEVSGLHARLKSNESHSELKIAGLMKQISDLELEAESLRTQKAEMEKRISGAKSLKDQLNVMQKNLDSLRKHNKELEAQTGRQKKDISQQLIQIKSLKEKLAEKTSVEQIMLEEKESLLVRIKDLELELESQRSQTNILEEHLTDKEYEINQLADENKVLKERNLELKEAMTNRGEELSALVKEYENGKNGVSIEAMALKEETKGLKLQLKSLQEQKIKLELESEKNKIECSESQLKLETLNTKLTSQIADQERIIKEQAETIDRIRKEYKEEMIWAKKFKLNQQWSERKMQEMADEFRKKIEDRIRLLSQRIHVAEMLHNENKESYKIVKVMYEEENIRLKQRIASYEGESDSQRKDMKVTATPMDVLNGLDSAAGKLEERNSFYMKRISNMMDEIEFVKGWIKRRNSETKQLKINVDCLTALLDEKEEQEFLLREKVWKLEAMVSKEGGEKLNMMKAMNQLEKKVVKLDKKLKERDEELVSLGEKKREAIRQLCFLNDYHRNRCDYLKDLVTKMRLNIKTRS